MLKLLTLGVYCLCVLVLVCEGRRAEQLPYVSGRDVAYPYPGDIAYQGDNQIKSNLLSQPDPRLVQRFLREPPDQTAKIGEQVTLPCRVQNKKGKLQWTRDDFGLGLGRDLTGFDRYKMTGSDQEDDYTLSIFPVQLEDDAVFQCQVGAAKGVAPIRSRYATLTVTVPPEPPVILNGDVLEVLEDREITLECISKLGKPAAEITWFDSQNIPIRDNVETVIETLADGKRQNTISLLHRTIRREDNLRNISCEAQNIAESVPHRATIQILVEYPPHVTIHYQPHHIQEGQSVTFKCSADANPGEVSYRWFVDREEVDGSWERSLTIDSVNRTLHGSILKCVVRNKIGRSEETHTLSVSYPPVWKFKPKDTSGEDGQTVTLTCLVDSNPQPRYTWYRGDDAATIIGRTRNLTVILTKHTEGEYFCRVEVTGFNPIQSFAMVLLKGPPVVGGEGSVLVDLGGRAELTCTASGVPPPQTVLWTRLGSILGSGQRRSIHTHSRDGVLYSSLILQDVHESELGPYNCTASNMYGSHYQAMQLTLREETSLVVPLSVGVSVGVLLTLAILLLVVHCRGANYKHPVQDQSSEKDEWESDPIAKDKHLIQVQEEEVPLNQHFDGVNQSPLSDKFRNINLNVQDPHYSAVYGNPYLRSAVEGAYYSDTYDQNFAPDDPLVPSNVYRPSAGVVGDYRPSPGVVDYRPNGVVDAQYIIRQDLLGSGLATHV